MYFRILLGMIRYTKKIFSLFILFFIAQFAEKVIHTEYFYFRSFNKEDGLWPNS